MYTEPIMEEEQEREVSMQPFGGGGGGGGRRGEGRRAEGCYPRFPHEDLGRDITLEKNSQIFSNFFAVFL